MANPRRKRKQLPNLALLDGVVAPRILNAMVVASQQYHRAGVPHALAGGLAVGAYGYPRATRDVDFLVGNEAFNVHDGGIVTMATGVPIVVADVAVDSLSIAPDERYLVEAVNTAPSSKFEGTELPVVSIEALFYLKLKSPRRKDAADIVELLKVGAPRKRLRDYIRENAPDMLDDLNELIEAADEES